jgi:hypothetical protein
MISARPRQLTQVVGPSFVIKQNDYQNMLQNSSTESLLERLINASDLALKDLHDNRLGYLSAYQKSRLTLLILIYLCISCICFGIGTLPTWLYLRFPNDFPLATYILWTIGLAFYGTLWIKNIFPMIKDLRDGKVLKITGTVHRLSTTIPFNGQKVHNAKITLIHYRIAGMLFNSIWVASKVLPDGQKCQVYYTPTSKIIVSVEPV